MLVLLLAWLAAPAVPVRAAKDEGENGAAGEKEKKDDHPKEHGPTAKEHVEDQLKEWHVFHVLDFSLPLVGWVDYSLFGQDYTFPTKYEWLVLIAAVLVAVIYIPLARRMQNGEPVTGTFWNSFEGLLTFVRDEVAKPNLAGHEHAHGTGQAGSNHGDHPGEGHGRHGEGALVHPADKYVPFLWTMFLFILFCNLLGMFPFLGSPTASYFVTGSLALICFLLFHAAPIAKHGLFSYLKALWPKIDLPAFYGIGWLFKNIICLMIFVIELFGTVIKSFVLAVRLFANMFAGHMVLASILVFIWAARNSHLWPVVLTASVLGQVGLSLLELFVAFLQAYIFVFLTALFLGMGLNPEH
jgi:F-type H+-transporting ATPase subunit a